MKKRNTSQQENIEEDELTEEEEVLIRERLRKLGYLGDDDD